MTLVYNSSFSFLHNLRYNAFKGIIGLVYKEVILWCQQLKRVENGAVQEQVLGMLLKLRGHKFKLQCYNFKMLRKIEKLLFNSYIVSVLQDEESSEYGLNGSDSKTTLWMYLILLNTHKN